MRMFRWLRKLTMGSVAIGILLLWYAVTGIFLYSHRSDDVQVDAAVVLGAAAYGSRPSPLFRARIDHAVDLYLAGDVEYLIFTGGVGNRSQFSEAAVARNYAMRFGVPASDILLEETSSNTRENFARVRPILDANNIEDVIIVSTPFHMRRAMFLANQNDIDAYASPTYTTPWREQNSLRPFFFTREVVAYLHHRLLWPWI